MDKRVLLNTVLYMFDIAEKFDKFKPCKLKFDDVEFLKADWKTNNEFLDKCPSLIYWLCKNQKCTQQIQAIYSTQKFEENRIPLWLLVLRIVSSINCVIFDVNQNTKTSEKICEMLHLEIHKTIQRKLSNHQKIGTNWLNLFLPTVPPEFIDQNIRLLHGFLYSLSEDQLNFNTTLNELKYKSIETFIKEIVILIFKSKFQEIIKSKPKEIEKEKIKNKVFQFIVNPNDLIINLINLTTISKLKKIKKAEQSKDLLNFLNKMKEDFPRFLKDFSNVIQQEEETKRNEYIQMKKEENEREREGKINELKRKISEYENLKNNLRENNKFDNCNEIKQKTLKKLNEITCSLRKCPEKIFDESNKITLKFYTKTKFSVYYKYIDVNIYPIVNIDYDKIFPIKKQNYASTAPKIIFGKNYYNNYNFLESLNDLNNIIHSEVQKIFDAFENAKISNNTFEIPKNLIDKVTKIRSNSTVKFSDETSCKETQEYAESLQKLLDHLDKHLKAFDNFIKENIKNYWNEVGSTNLHKEMFSNSYQIPYPSTTIEQYVPSFDDISDSNFFSTPILSVSKGSIQCCYKTLNCPIGPLVPSLYEGNVLINFISSIDEEFSIDVKAEKEEYSNLFYARHNIKPGEIVQILVSLPPLNNDITELNISTQIHFTSQSYKELKLPCNFYFKLIPLAILIECEEYQLSFKEGIYNLCCQEILSGSAITFNFKNYYMKEELKYFASIESLEGNTSEKPDLNTFKDHIIVNMPSVKEMSRLHCNVCLTFSSTFMITINIDAILIPFDFTFEIYDFSTKRYTNNLNIYYSKNKDKWYIPLHCKIIGTPHIGKQIAELTPNLPRSAIISTKPDDIYVQEIFEFDMMLEYATSQYLYYPYSLTIKSHKLTKKININFKDATNMYVNLSYPVLIFNNENNNWEIPNYSYNRQTLSISKIFVTPFEFNNQMSSNITIKYYDNEIRSYNISCEYVHGCVTGKFKINQASFRVNIDGEQEGIALVGFDNKGQWFPAFSIYPEIDDLNELEISEENIEEAKTKSFNILNLIETHSDIKERDFRYFIFLSMYNIFIVNINKFIQYLPGNLKKNIIDLVPNNIKSHEPIIDLYRYNIIIRIYKLFKQRYNELKENDFKLYPSPQPKEMKQKMNELYEEYIQFDEQTIQSQIQKEFKHKFKEENKNYEEFINQIPKNDTKQSKSKCYLTNEFKESFKKNFNEQNIIEQNEVQQDALFEISFNFDTLSKVNSIPGKHDSISSLIEFYSSCIQGTRILPIYIRNLKNSKQSFEPAEKYYSRLLQIYLKLQPTDSSFLSPYIKSFCESFKLLTSKLAKAGVNIRKPQIPNVIINESQKLTQDFIELPQPCQIYQIQTKWKTVADEKNLKHKRYDLINQSSNQILSNDQFDNEDDQIPIIPNEQNSNNGKIFYEQKRSQETDFNVKFQKVFKNMQEVLQKDNMNDDDTESESETKERKEDKNINNRGFLLINDETKTEQISSKQFDESNNAFTEEQGIERTIQRMKEIKNEENYKVIEQQLHKIQNDKPNKDVYPIQELIQQSYYLSAAFIKAASDTTTPYSNICVCILIDCKSYISDKNKMFNMMIICALTSALYSLEIPYSVLLIADDNFTCVIKPFEEDHSDVALQKILDCYLIKRGKTNLIHSIKYAMSTIHEKVLEKRPNISFFTFTDGIDENLVRTKVWSNLLVEPNYSFGFIFIKSSKLIDDKLKYVENVWRNFEEETNQNAKSFIKISIIQAQISNQIIKSIIELFKNVMKREVIKNLPSQFKEITKPEFPGIIPELNNIKYFEDLMKVNFNNCNGIYSGRTNVLSLVSNRFEKLEMSHYRNKSNRINSNINKKNQNINIEKIISQFIERKKIYNSSIETIFKPNKASQTILSSTGTDFDITALILNIINPVPDPLIYLVEKGGLIRNYGVTIIIDPSISCFNELSGAHTFQTIRNLLSVFTILDLPSFDLIIAGSPTPNVLCSGVSTFYALNPKSPIWETLFSYLRNQITNIDLASAIHTAFDLRRIKSADYSSILFIITDGLYQVNEQKRIIEQVNSCVQYGINTIGIGVGIYPKGILNLFPQVVYSPNPSHLMNGIASIFGEDVTERLDQIHLIQNKIPNSETLEKIFNDLIKCKDNPTFSELQKELHDIPLGIDAFSDFCNLEQNVRGANNEFINPTGKGTQMLLENSLQGQKILIVMLWTKELSESETKYLLPYYIHHGRKGQECIDSALQYFGITTKVVLNYYDAIKELTKNNNECDYYATWVMCGPPYEVLPPQPNQHVADPNLVGQFIEVLIQFWQNGGSIVFWAEGKPLYYQVNLFLERAKFPELQNECSELRIGGEHAGEQTLYGDETGKLDKPKTFNRKPQITKGVTRTSLAHNLGKIYEGKTISYVLDEKKMKPFIPFSHDSAGGISSMFYPCIPTKNGDIIIDCGYTKCFKKMFTDGTFRYIQNIAGWTARPEIHYWVENCDPKRWRPKPVKFDIRIGEKWNKFLAMPSQIKTRLFAIDTSGSVHNKDFYHNELKNIINKHYKSGDKIFTWNSSYKEVTYNEMLGIISKKYGTKGTASDLIADIAARAGNNYHDHLIIVTDGVVNCGTVQIADGKMRKNNIKFKKVTAYIINYNQNSSSDIDFSVAAPYCRACPNESYYIVPGKPWQKKGELMKEDLDALNRIKSISTYNEFINVYNALDRAIQAKTVGTSGDEKLRNDLNLLKSKIINKLSGNDKINFEAKWNALFGMASGSLSNTFSLNDVAAAKSKSCS